MAVVVPIDPIPGVGEAPARLVIYKHCECTQAQMKATLGAAFEALYGRIAEAGVATAGPPFVVYNGESSPGVSWDMDICAPVAEPMTPRGDIGFREMPAERVVQVLHFGPYRTLGTAYESIGRYIEEHGLVRSGPPREIYLSEANVPEEEIETVIEQPIV